MRRPLVAGNWKMNGTLTDVEVLTKGLVDGLGANDGAVEAVICPPFVYLHAVSGQIGGSGIALGAQTASEHVAGAYTGEVSVAMLADFGCRYVIVGHSERRALFGETDGAVAQKFSSVQAAGMVPILCVGETLEERQANETETVLGRQIDAILDCVGASDLTRGVIAYEPVWAIGTGQNASPDQANAVHKFIRGRVGALEPKGAENMQILYGGSVKSSNCEQLFAMPDIDGGLIGGASLKAEEFVSICRAAV
ncbi:MAG TPA: triose-phosphate isomerase [Gammaproteobacteria bacterium]